MRKTRFLMKKSNFFSKNQNNPDFERHFFHSVSLLRNIYSGNASFALLKSNSHLSMSNLSLLVPNLAEFYRKRFRVTSNLIISCKQMFRYMTEAKLFYSCGFSNYFSRYSMNVSIECIKISKCVHRSTEHKCEPMNIYDLMLCSHINFIVRIIILKPYNRMDLH